MMSSKKGFTHFLLVLPLALSLFAQAGGVTPYLPANMSIQFENDIEKLAVLTNIPQLTKPYNVATVLAHLNKIKTSHPGLYKRLDKALAAYSSKTALSHARLSLSYSDTDEDAIYPLPNQMGSTTDQTYRLKVHGHWQETPWLGVYGGIDTSNERTVPSGSVLALGTSWAQLDIGYKERWWSPFQGSAQMISTNAETLPSIGLSNNTPIELFGTTFNYDVFVAQTSRQMVRYQEEWSDKNKPFFSGMHFSFQPTEWWSIGVNRMFQFGGGERETGIKDILRAIVDPRGADNVEAEQRDQEVGNQIASITSKMNFEDFSIYMEYSGEDTSNNKAWQLGNSAINAGIYIPFLVPRKASLTYEYSEWQESWYSHHLYQQGMSHQNVIIGNSFHSLPEMFRDGAVNHAGNSQFINLHCSLKANRAINIKLSETQTELPRGNYLRAEISYSFFIMSSSFDLKVFSEKIRDEDSYLGITLSSYLN